jgi:NAD(P)-dependent dehydrogenase (short-subunit alcohol dehydrogenase family)
MPKKKCIPEFLAINYPNDKVLNMKNILITGSEGQLGKYFSNKLLEQGHNVTGYDVQQNSSNNDLSYRQVDITKESEVRAAVEDLGEKLDVLINNAGTAAFTPFEERTEEEIDRVMDVNIKGLLFLTQQVFTKIFKPNSGGRIINMGSIYGVVSGDMNIYKEGDRRTSEIYGASKAAVIQLTKYFSTYMAPFNVSVNCISPGGIFNHQSESFVKAYTNKVPMKKMGHEEDLFAALDFLISTSSSYLTGQNIIIDGGLTAW